MSLSSTFTEMRRRVFEQNGLDGRCVDCSHVQIQPADAAQAFACDVFLDAKHAWRMPGGCPVGRGEGVEE